jgi:chromosome segregation ATPase
MHMNAISSNSANGAPGEIIYKEKVVYRENENKENKELEEELRNKENLLKNEQEEKILLQKKLEELQQNFQIKGPDSDDKSEMEKIKKLKEKLKQQKKKEEEFKKEKEKRENELLNIEKNYKNLNEEVD